MSIKTFFTTTLSIAMLVVTVSFAQSGANLGMPAEFVITKPDIPGCTTATCDINNNGNTNNGGTYDPTASTTSQQIGGSGTLNTGAINGATTVKSAAPGATPKASASQLATCSSIAFISLFDILIWVKCIITAAIIPTMFTLAFLFFLWGILKFMMAADIKGRDEGKKFISWGIVGLFVMISVWGIIKIVSDTLGINNTVPTLQTEYLSTSKANKKP